MLQNKALMTLGLFVFMRQTAPFQTMTRNQTFRQPTNSVIGSLPKTQFTGKESETVEIQGVLIPEITGGKLSLLALEQMAEAGESYPLIRGGDFALLGHFVIEAVNITSSVFHLDGSPRKYEFSLKLKRTDESLLNQGLEFVSDKIGGLF